MSSLKTKVSKQIKIIFICKKYQKLRGYKMSNNGSERVIASYNGTKPIALV